MAYVQVANLRKGMFGDSGSWKHTEDWLIRVKKGLTPSTAATTVLHELLHVFDGQYELGLDEPGVRSLEMALVSLIRDNPAYVRRLVEDILDKENPDD